MEIPTRSTTSQSQLIDSGKDDNVVTPIGSAPTQDHYRNVKMKYFRSLGVNHGSNTVPGLVPNSLPVHSENSFAERMAAKSRNNTVVNRPPELDSYLKDDRKRSTSTPPKPGQTNSNPLPIYSQGMPIAIPSQIRNAHANTDFSDSEEEQEEKEEQVEQELSFADRSFEDELEASSFIPPHELLSRQHNSAFNVGTAHSLAVWEQKRRNMMNV